MPVAYNFAKKFEVVGFDINKKRVTELKKFKDKNNSFTEKQLRHINIFFSSETKYLLGTDVYIITTPSPFNNQK